MIRVLIADDSAFMRKVLSDLFTEAPDFEVAGVAFNGKDAVEKALRLKPDLLTMDVNMPVMDGLSFVKAAKQLPAYKFTPVIMLTTEAGEAKKAEGKAAGVRAWIVKPFQPPMLLDAVSKLVM